MEGPKFWTMSFIGKRGIIETIIFNHTTAQSQLNVFISKSINFD